MLLIQNATPNWTKSTFFYLHIQEIIKVVCKKILSGLCCMKPSHTFITSACWSHRIAPSFVGAGPGCAWQRFLAACKQLCWFPGRSAGKKIKILFSSWWCLELATSPIAWLTSFWCVKFFQFIQFFLVLNNLPVSRSPFFSLSSLAAFSSSNFFRSSGCYKHNNKLNIYTKTGILGNYNNTNTRKFQFL